MIPCDGGPAFPCELVDLPANPEPGRFYPIEKRLERGMSMRDYFAGQALAGLVTHQRVEAKQVAEDSYMLADAMLVAGGEK